MSQRNHRNKPKLTKKQWFNICYWSLSGMLIWIILFVLAFNWAQKSLKDSLMIPSVVLFGLTLLAILLKLGLFERSILRYRNSRFNFTSREIEVVHHDAHENRPHPLTLQNYHKILRQRLWSPLLINLMLYIILLIVSIVI